MKNILKGMIQMKNNILSLTDIRKAAEAGWCRGTVQSGIDIQLRWRCSTGLYRKVRYPVAPDSWLVLQDGGLKFIEGKHNEKLENTQLVGLALIKKYLDCSISIMRVYPKNDTPPIPIYYSDSFSAMYVMLWWIIRKLCQTSYNKYWGLLGHTKQEFQW